MDNILLSKINKCVSIKSGHTFDTNEERDDHFTNNASQLKQYTYCVVGNQLQQYLYGKWVDASILWRGEKGETGESSTILIGSVDAGDTASITNSGTDMNPIFNFVLPKGDKGNKGDTGATGATGMTGASGIIWKGDYNDIITYSENDAVYSNGTTYYCHTSSTGLDPKDDVEELYFHPLALMGAAGADGKSVLFDWTSTSLGIKNTDDEEYQYVDLKGNTGHGIVSITAYYMASPNSSGITYYSMGWSTAVQQTTPINKYLWMMYEVLWTDNARTYIQAHIVGSHGADYIDNILEYLSIDESNSILYSPTKGSYILLNQDSIYMRVNANNENGYYNRILVLDNGIHLLSETNLHGITVNDSGASYDGYEIAKKSEIPDVTNLTNLMKHLTVTPTETETDKNYFYSPNNNSYISLQDSDVEVNGDANFLNSVQINEYTKLGSAAPAIQYKEITGVLPNSAGYYIDYPIGVSSDKVLSVQMFVANTNGDFIPPFYNDEFNSRAMYYSYKVQSDGDLRVITNQDSTEVIMGQSFKALIGYTE